MNWLLVLSLAIQVAHLVALLAIIFWLRKHA
jgi:hypothetical protein